MTRIVSILNEMGENWELIIVDGGSTDCRKKYEIKEKYGIPLDATIIHRYIRGY